jgi:hypothetical protein
MGHTMSFLISNINMELLQTSEVGVTVSLNAESCGQVVNTPASYSRGSTFKSWPGDLLS